jgi:hypothetical protein
MSVRASKNDDTDKESVSCEDLQKLHEAFLRFFSSRQTVVGARRLGGP